MHFAFWPGKSPARPAAPPVLPFSAAKRVLSTAHLSREVLLCMQQGVELQPSTASVSLPSPRSPLAPDGAESSRMADLEAAEHPLLHERKLAREEALPLEDSAGSQPSSPRWSLSGAGGGAVSALRTAAAGRCQPQAAAPGPLPPAPRAPFTATALLRCVSTPVKPRHPPCRLPMRRGHSAAGHDGSRGAGHGASAGRAVQGRGGWRPGPVPQLSRGACLRISAPSSNT